MTSPRLFRAIWERKTLVTDVWVHLGPTALAAFLASLVECVEALTIVLAVGAVRGWRDALGGCLTALFVLAAIVAIFGRGLSQVPLPSIQLFVGALLLLFGLRWLRKAILRSAGVIPLHDETGAFQKERQRLALEGETVGWDKIAFATSFQITMLEGAEVVFIVLGIGAGSVDLLRAGSIGALAALAFVTVVGAVVRRPLATVPENELKFVVGILLSAFGTFWFGEGAGLVWPGADWSLVVLIAAYLCVALVAVRACHSRRPQVTQAKSRPGGV
jgi:Ca2+/H+ antiporter, TMEM165/GDT1 family